MPKLNKVEPQADLHPQTQMEPTPRPLHTPGPWKSDGRTVYSDKGSVVHDRSGIRMVRRFCLEVLTSAHEGDMEKEAEANARLIAAAPDLLETLRQIQEVCEHRYLTTGHVEIRGLIDIAIAKAEGREVPSDREP